MKPEENRNGDALPELDTAPCSAFDPLTMEMAVENLKEGDLVDLKSCPFLKSHPFAESEYALVDRVEAETGDCVAVSYEYPDQVGYAPGTRLRVKVVVGSVRPHRFEVHDGDDPNDPRVWCRHCNTARNENPGTHDK